MKRRKNNIKKRTMRKKRKLFILLTKLILCLAIIGIAFIITINHKIKSSSYAATSQEVASEKDNENSVEKDNEQSPEKDNENTVQKDRDPFEGIPVINDNRGVPVICYHSISSDASKKSSIIMSKEKFRQHLQTIKDDGYTTLTMTQLNDYLFKDKPIPEKSVVITFDDGYMDNYTNAFPILKEFNMNATIFVISSYLTRGEPYMTPKEVKEMSDYGIDIESHTVSHVELAKLSYEDQLKQLKDSKEAIENITGKSISAIAYPVGSFNEDTKKATAEAGYSMGFTIQRGYADRDDNPNQLNRICVDYTYKPNDIDNVLKKLAK